MDETPNGAARPSRRTIARGAAWSVPVVAVGAAAPAMAASGGTASVTASCGSGATGSFDISVTGSLSSVIRVTFVRTGNGNFTLGSVPSTWVLASQTPNVVIYDITVADGLAGGAVNVSFQLGQNGSATVEASVSSPTGQVITGDLSSSITKRRDGNSSNYTCSTT